MLHPRNLVYRAYLPEALLAPSMLKFSSPQAQLQNRRAALLYEGSHALNSLGAHSDQSEAPLISPVLRCGGGMDLPDATTLHVPHSAPPLRRSRSSDLPACEHVRLNSASQLPPSCSAYP